MNLQMLRNLIRIYWAMGIVIFIVVSLFIMIPILFGNEWKGIESDGFGYYLYLPQIFIYKDVFGMEMFQHFNEWQALAAKGRLIEMGNGNFLNKYPIGTAILMSPFFFFADFLNIFIGQTDYFIGIYSVSVSMGTVVYLVLGLLLLYQILRKYFSISIVNWTILSISLGSNLIYYAVHEPAFSHVYSFFLFAYLLYKIVNFRIHYSYRDYFITGAIFGLIVAVRQTNIIVALLFFLPLIHLYKLNFLRRYIQLNWKGLLLMVFAAILLFIPQLIYWYLITGKPIFFSYVGESFNFLKPEIIQVLFSVRKGLFFWSPILILSFIGFYIALKMKFYSVYMIFLILIVQTYLVSSWWAWSFGDSFGHRAFTEFLVFFSLPLGLTYNKLWKFGNRLKSLIIILVFMFSSLNLFHMHQYMYGNIYKNSQTWHAYIKLFLPKSM
ncbi:hypothetical protein [Leptospira sp. GIMC2001]|uniref:hypothetical protein n=1 Tax=Leptospira sp. GIMC2001 TaxID=1513297 RepID=UPI002349E1F7|nr:hypothetical protein [Leptospira sp. GIMC2001]WCL50555.1 hypothetical protein O4O04_06985 [Leptospira sp. GIMC2001]